MMEELDEFYKDHDEDENKKNFRLLIDEWESLDFQLPKFETFDIKPVLDTDKGLIETVIKRKRISHNRNNLF